MRNLLVVALLAACTAPLEEGFESALQAPRACGDLLMVAPTDADDMMLTIRADEPFGVITPTDSRTLELKPGTNVSVVVSLGTNVSATACLSGTESQVDIEYVATAGTVTLALEAIDGVATLDATLTDLTLTEASVGYFRLPLAAWSATDVPYDIPRQPTPVVSEEE